MAQIDEKSGSVLREAFEFSRVVREKMLQSKHRARRISTGGADGSVDALKFKDPCADLLLNLGHLLGWGGRDTDSFKLSIGGVEREDDSDYFYMGFSITKPGFPEYGSYNGCIMFRDGEWSAHS